MPKLQVLHICSGSAAEIDARIRVSAICAERPDLSHWWVDLDGVPISESNGGDAPSDQDLARRIFGAHRVAFYHVDDVVRVLPTLDLSGRPAVLIQTGGKTEAAGHGKNCELHVDIAGSSELPTDWIQDSLEIARALGTPVRMATRMQEADILVATAKTSGPTGKIRCFAAVVPVLHSPDNDSSGIFDHWIEGCSEYGDPYALARQINSCWTRIAAPGTRPLTKPDRPEAPASRSEELNPIVRFLLSGKINLMVDQLVRLSEESIGEAMIQEAFFIIARLSAEPGNEFGTPDSRLSIGPRLLLFMMDRLSCMSVALRFGRTDLILREVDRIRHVCGIDTSTSTPHAGTDRPSDTPTESSEIRIGVPRFSDWEKVESHLPKVARAFEETCSIERQAFFDQPSFVRGSHAQRVRIARLAGDSASKFPGNLVEIGAYVGHTTCILASVARRFGRRLIVIDPWEIGGPGDCGATFETFKSNTREFADVLDILRASSLDEAVKEVVRDRPLCFAYVDGLHTYDACLSDILTVSHTLGAIAVDDVLWKPELSDALHRGAELTRRTAVHYPIFREGYLVRAEARAEAESQPASSKIRSADSAHENVMG